MKNRPDMVWEDQGSVVMKFPSGLTATVELSMNVTADNLIGEHAHVYGCKSSLWINHVHGMWFGIPLYKFIATQVRMYNALSPFTGIGMPVPVAAHPGIYMHKRQIEYFIDGILGRDRDYFGFGPDFAASGEDGLALIKIIDDIYAADRKTKPEKKTAAKKPAEKKKTAATKTAIKKASKNPA